MGDSTYPRVEGESSGESIHSCGDRLYLSFGESGHVIEYRGWELRSVECVKLCREEYEALQFEFECRIRMEFIKYLALQCQESLLAAGLTTHKIGLMQYFGMVPCGYLVQHIHPSFGGGSNEFSNLMLVRCDRFYWALNAFRSFLLGALSKGEICRLNFPMPVSWLPVYPCGASFACVEIPQWRAQC